MLIKIGQRAKQLVFANQLVLSLALLSGFLTIIANRSGVGWSWDTSDYVAVGKNFANGNGLLDATGIMMTVRPPGLSLARTKRKSDSANTQQCLCRCVGIGCTPTFTNRRS